MKPADRITVQIETGRTALDRHNIEFAMKTIECPEFSGGR
jgi:hypothetical protein